VESRRWRATISFDKSECISGFVGRPKISVDLLDPVVVALEDVLMRQLYEQGIDGAHSQHQQRLEYDGQPVYDVAIKDLHLGLES